MARGNNYTKQMESARKYFLHWDQEKIIKSFDLEHDGEFIYVKFFGSRYGVNRSTGTVLRGEILASFEEAMSIYDALCYRKEGAALTGEWRTLKNLSPHSNFGSSDSDFFGRAAQNCAGRIEGLRAACLSLGGRESTKADVGFQFEAFPFLPIVFQFWDGDEEFAPRISFLFDAGTLDFIHFETAWYVSGYLMELIEAAMGEG